MLSAGLELAASVQVLVQTDTWPPSLQSGQLETKRVRNIPKPHFNTTGEALGKVSHPEVRT